MGRYYNTNTGRDGKFMFAVQPSSDPEVMGMHEQGATYINYYAEKSDENNIKENLEKEYDALEIPKEDRIYYIELNGQEKYAKYEREHFFDKVFIYVKKDDKEALEKYKGMIPYVSDRDEYECFGTNEKVLHLARIRLALIILSDIKDDGYCELEAEL